MQPESLWAVLKDILGHGDMSANMDNMDDTGLTQGGTKGGWT